MKSPIRFLMRVPVPLVFVLTYLLGVALESIRPLSVSRLTALVSTIVVGLVFVVGAIIAGWSLAIFHRSGTTTVPGQPSVKLVTWGPYRFTRNPMYSGLPLAYLGEAALLKQIWPVVLLHLTLVYLNWTVIPIEEAKLEQVFPDEYEQYCRRVGRWI